MTPVDAPRMLSRPVEVHWAGWRTTTVALQRAGWQLSAEQDVCYRTLRIAMRHRELKMYMVSRPVDFDYYGVSDPRAFPTQIQPLVIEYAANRMDLMIHETAMPKFEPIDAEPQVSQTRIVSLDDLKIFAPPLVRTEELIVDPATVDDMLQRIREMQAPEQARIRAKQRLEATRYEDGTVLESRVRQKFHAQIISIAA